MAYNPATAVEIDKKLREDFRRRLKDFGISAETTDPVLAVLFRTFAGRLESLYAETEQIRLALLDELIAGLGIERRAARPAQTVVRFLLESGSELIDGGTELVGEAQSGERLTFTTDAPVAVSAARIALGATYQEGILQLMPGVEMPEQMQAARPSLEPVKVNLGPNPAVFLAIENLPPLHLSRHGFFFELSPDAESLRRALLSEAWCVAGPDGSLGAKGILRPRRGNAGVRFLEWLIDHETAAAAPEKSTGEVPQLMDGFYAGRIFLLPEIPPERRFLCRMPKGMEAALAKIFGRAGAPALEQPRAWIRIGMPRRAPNLHTGIGSIWLHAVSASNVECFNETVRFDEQGGSIPVSREAGAAKYLVAPLSIFGEAKSVYLPEFEPSPDADAGRYSIHNGRIRLRPAKGQDNKPDAYANLRLWLSSGSLGNTVGPGKVQAFLKRPGSPGLRISNPTSAAGGTDGESFQDAQARFACALLSRDRIVTRADLAAAARSFDRRIRSADVSMGLERTPRGIRRVQRVRCLVDRNDFLDPEEEARVLGQELQLYLQERFLYDIELSLKLEWQ
jgi:hypothetical protein